MKNNSTRKGLAIVAASSLLVAGFAGLPAQAAGISDGSVSLIPTTGAEYATVSGGSMTLSANAATGVLGTGKYLKYQVEDALGKTSVTETGTTQYSQDATGFSQANTANTVTVTLPATHRYNVGDEVAVAGFDYNPATGRDTAVIPAAGTEGSTNAVAQVSTIALTGDATSDKYTVTINGTASTQVVWGTNTGATEAAVVVVINGAYGAAVTAAITGGDIVVTADVPGVPFTVSVAVVAGSSGEAAISATTANVLDVDTIVVAGTGQNGDVVSVTVDPAVGANVVLTHTIVAGDTTTTIAAGLAATNAIGTSSGATVTVTGAATMAALVLAGSLVESPAVVAKTNTTRAKITAKTSTTITFADATVAADAAFISDAGTVKILASTPALGKYIRDTKDATNTADKTIKLQSTDQDVTQTVTVTAWIDSNDDGDIDSTEYASPARTVTFLAHSAITSTLTWRPVSVGDATVVADVTFSPTLNGSQYSVDRTNAIGALQVQMTRPGTAEVEPAATVTYSNTTKKWTATSKNMNSNDWAISDAVAQATNAANANAITNNIVTITTNGVMNLAVGDTVIVANSATGRVNHASAVVLSTPTTKTFTYAVTTANQATAAVANVADGAITVAITGGASNILRDSAVAGTYTGQVQLYKYAAVDALTNIGSVTSNGVNASTASATITAPTFSGVASATVNAAGTAVKTGTNAANYKLSVYNVLGNPVGAGISVTVTTTTVTSAGTVTLNGVTVITGSTQILTTDASGQVALAVNNSSGAAAESIVFNASVQNVAATSMTSTWAGSVYSILDMDDQNTANSVRTRAAVAGASHTMNLKVQDQWGQAIDGAVYRLAASTTQGGIATVNNVSIVAGAATVTVPDAGLGGATTVALTFQKLTGSTWALSDTTSVNDWNGAAGNDLGTVAVNYYAATQVDAFTFNADAATLPSGTAANLTVDVTTVALASADTRFGETAGTYTAASKAVLGGKIASSTTGAAKSGQAITVSAVGILFKAGNVWATDSLTFLSSDGTFSVEAYSRVSGIKAITFTAGALSGTVSTTFATVAGAGGYTISLTTPATVAKGSTMRVEGQILDVNGNGVALTTAGTGANPTLSVTYLGLGLVSGALPTTTDATGKFYFYVLVGSNDAGTATVTASYDHNGTTTDTATLKKVTASKTIYIGQAAPSATKVNAGSFKGYVALYAKGYKGQRMSAKVGKDWVVIASLASNFERVVEFTGKGVDVAVRIYIDRVLMDTINLTTK
jgi:hypothetical protein